ncbi:hypothetical protein BGW36DRAFT_386840 [Talaromyces proteolyticus]|uniref:Ig-like domain-containing protein n=1 Tax=Talaromyces proteolyticus TaxID=1131652 RepID=A0AAD4PW17_9EURO|nr:uncharacterized protein BGW36DRAFT_386840 [Talaromyces proteolyticus]KAH8692023.1 hypothetical protein BGW36DRAFT_386840 [Talaromyces proteolyticus]
MRATTLLATAFSSLVVANNPTVVGFIDVDIPSVTIPSYTSEAASVTGINADATTYEISCLANAPTTLCQIKDPWTLIQGTSSFSFTGVYTGWISGDVNGVTATRDMTCSFTSISESVSCSFSYKATGTTDGQSYSTSTSISGTYPPDSVTYIALTVTGGLDSFTAPQATETPKGVAGPAAAQAMITAAPLGAAAVMALAAAF